MIDYPAFRAELARPDYAGLSLAEQEAAFLAAVDTVDIDVPVSQVEGYLRARLLMTAIEDWIADPANAAAGVPRQAARELVGIISGRVSVFEMTVPSTRGAISALLGEMVSAGVGGLTVTHRDTILVMGKRSVSRAAAIGYDPALHDFAQEVAAAERAA